MTTVAVVQARMSSSRFPGKMLALLHGVPLVVFVCRRVAAARHVDKVVLATSDHPSDDLMAEAVLAAGFAVYRGSLADVLGRMTGAARECNADIVVRITGDCPLMDPPTLEAMLEHFAGDRLDYLCNIAPPTFPDGLDVEIMKMAALTAADAEAQSSHQREHVTPFIRENPGRFKSGNWACPYGDQSHCLWSVDSAEDLELVSRIVKEAGENINLPALLAVVKANPELAARTGRRRNEGAIRTCLADLERRKPRPVITESERWWKRAKGLIPAGTQTLSKGPTQWVRGFAPKYIVSGKGCRVTDADGNQFIDYPMGLGPITLGHAHPVVVEAVARQLAEGNAFTMMHPLEVTLSERIRSLVPCARGDGCVRFGKNGSDATSACIRAARAKTGRTYVARHGYHGWQDWSIESTYGIRAKGVPPEIMAQTSTFPYNDINALEQLLRSRAHAAIIMEPVNLTPPSPGYLEGVRQLASHHGVVLVFDEVITGFRYARGGAQEYFGVTPDLCAMGKGVANGMPLSIVCGKREFMEPFDEIFFSFTFGGETAGLAAAMATLDVMEREDYWSHVWRQGAKLQNGFRALANEFGINDHVDCQGMPPWTVVVFKDHARWKALQLKTLFQQEMIRHGILFSGSQFLSLAHGDAEIADTISAYREAFTVLRFAIDNQAVDVMTLGEVDEVIFKRG